MVLSLFFPAGSKTDLAAWFSPVKAKELLEGCDENVPSSPTLSHTDTPTHTRTQTHTHTHEDCRGDNSNRESDLQSHPSFFLCFSQPEEPCLCGCAQPPLHCLAVSSYHLRLERDQLDARLHQSACERGGDVTALAALSRFELGLCVCVCMGLCLLIRFV